MSLAAGGLAAAPVWQLGVDDGSAKEFQIQYHAWEYGNAPAIQSSKAMDHKTHTFRYAIGENVVIPAPDMVSGLYTVSERAWMNADEIVCNLALSWREKEAGRRLLTVKCAKWANQHNGVDGIEVLLPGGKKQVFNLPDGHSSANGPFSFEVVFDAAAGENTLTIRNVSRAKHYSFSFDCIRLEATDRAPLLPPVLEPAIEGFSGILHPGEPVNLTLRVLNQGVGKAEYTVKDLREAVVKSGSISISGGQGKALLPSDRKGWYSVECRFDGVAAKTSYVVVEPVTPEYLADSRFGSHAITADGYRLRDRDVEREELKMRRASLGGTRWVRMHSLRWSLREPEKGKFVWDNADERFALAERYQMHILLTLGYQPLWASASTDRTLTMCGDERFTHYPPKDPRDWAEFLTTLVGRYKDRIRHYEIGNEPAYTSAFWCNGSPVDFGTYLKTAYEAIKAAQPEAVVYPGAPIQVDFLEEAVKSNGGKPYFDLLSAHYLRNNKRGSVKAEEWKRMLINFGMKPELVNSEDMGWIDSKDPVEALANVVRLHIRDASQGVLRTFGFEMFDDNSSMNYSFFDRQDNPLPHFALYRAMTHRLEGAAYVGDLSGAEFEAYLFNRNGVPVIAFWSDREVTFRLPVGSAPVKLVSAEDNESAAAGKDGILEVTSRFLPQYLEGGDLALLKSLADAMAVLPKELLLGAGKTASSVIALPEGVACEKLELPAGWSGKLANSRLEVAVPAAASAGVYDAAFSLKLKGLAAAIPVPFMLEISTGSSGNLAVNGDFEQGGSCWFYPNDKAVWNVLPGVGVDGSSGVRTKGTAHFGTAGKPKVRPGERYLLAYDVRGEGTVGVAYGFLNKEWKTVFPANPGINALYTQASPEWKRVWEVIPVNHPEAAYLSFSVLTNHGDTTGKELFIDNVVIARLAGSTTVNKVLNQGTFVGKKTEWNLVPAVKLDQAAKVVLDSEKEPWRGPADLSGTMRMMLDGKNMYLRFDIRDDKLMPGTDDLEKAWQGDSLQFAIDPLNDNRGCTEFLVGRRPDGKAFVYKYTNYWTPELPDNITRRGLVPGAEATARPVEGGIVYEIRIPLYELYPLKADVEEFGFNFLFNDDDGRGRKYIEWSGGIGKTKNPGEYGVMRRQK